jgi:hypothetical protein
MLQRNVTQGDLRAARKLRLAAKIAATHIASRIEAGALVEPGRLAFDDSRVIPRRHKRDLDRFILLLRLTETRDLKVLKDNPAAAAKLRQTRARIFRAEIRDLRDEVSVVFHRRLDRIGENGRWDAYLPLFADTFSAYRSLAALAVCGTLFSRGVRLPCSLPKRAEKVRRYLTWDASPALLSA